MKDVYQNGFPAAQSESGQAMADSSATRTSSPPVPMRLERPNAAQLSGIGMTSQRTRDRMVTRLEEAGIQDERVLDLMAAEPRHLFLDEALAHRAYEDTALPLGQGQTLSQPYMHARMTELALASAPRPREQCRVLEVGTGSGYQTLLLARLFGQVASLERIALLHLRARQRLEWFGLDNVQLRHADGGHGWQTTPRETAAQESVTLSGFDLVVVTACASHLPQALLQQLAPEGVMIVPLAEDGSDRQWLTRVRHVGDTQDIQRLEAVRFVPLLEGVIR